jgi:hypothetical protein
MRRFMGLDFALEQGPDATTLLRFRHLLEARQFGERLFAAQNEIFEREGVDHAERVDHRRHHHRGTVLDQERLRYP